MQTQAERIIKKFGGVRRLAAILGYDRSSVYRWNHPVSKRGCGGLVPIKSMIKIAALAPLEGVVIEATDFLPSERVEQDPESFLD